MQRRIGRLGLLALSVLAGCGIALTSAEARNRAGPGPTDLGKDFVSETATVNGVTRKFLLVLPHPIDAATPR